MKLDQIADKAATELRGAGRKARFTATAPGPRRGFVSGPVVALAGFLAVLMVGLPVWLLTTSDVSPSTGSPGDPTPPQSTAAPIGAYEGILTLAEEGFPVGEVIEAFADAPMYQATVLDAPTFNTVPYGQELPLLLATASVGDPDIIDGPAIYIGDIGPDSAFLTEETIQAAGEETLSPQKCLWVGASLQICGDFGSQAVRPSGDPVVAVWLGVPDGTVAVAALQGEQAIGWQQPQSDVVIIPVQDGEVTLVAIDSEGRELLRVEMTSVSNQNSDQGVSVTTTEAG